MAGGLGIGIETSKKFRQIIGTAYGSNGAIHAFQVPELVTLWILYKATHFEAYPRFLGLLYGQL